MNTEPELLNERLERLAIVLDEIMPQCALLVRDAISMLKEQEKMLKEQEVRLLTEKEATAWCEDYNKETVRTKPVVEEYLRPFDKAHWFEWITPDNDYFTADIVGYNEQVRLWTGMPTEEQWKAEKWKT